MEKLTGNRKKGDPTQKDRKQKDGRENTTTTEKENNTNREHNNQERRRQDIASPPGRGETLPLFSPEIGRDPTGRSWISFKLQIKNIINQTSV